jgi:hypothetical protein
MTRSFPSSDPYQKQRKHLDAFHKLVNPSCIWIPGTYRSNSMRFYSCGILTLQMFNVLALRTKPGLVLTLLYRPPKLPSTSTSSIFHSLWSSTGVFRMRHPHPRTKGRRGIFRSKKDALSALISSHSLHRLFSFMPTAHPVQASTKRAHRSQLLVILDRPLKTVRN